ncbi:hypothetical protein [Rhodovulum sulfidophilum]|uniref:hypothetical protein n=1 Tax=Rhodovulum sulfidophilum TaxID=35806 RepID=UPI00095350E7|nr:hypothetical protein [Rhodovulum sulfidophilum]MBL3553476.1 hypothetical protein [Rhodovulum sulfidophilum]OLS49654.1 hypothetical protein BV379_16125 [Rhodovulum sulfidophilum]
MARKDVNARRTVGYSKAKSHADGSKPVNRALPTFGDTSHISIAPQSAITRRQIIANPTRHDDARPREGPVQRTRTALKARADPA